MKQNLLNSLRLRLCMLVALFCTLSTSVWGTDVTATLTGSSIVTGTSTSYTDYTSTGVTDDDSNIWYGRWCYQKTGSTMYQMIQLRAYSNNSDNGNCSRLNVPTFKGIIKSITLKITNTSATAYNTGNGTTTELYLATAYSKSKVTAILTNSSTSERKTATFDLTTLDDMYSGEGLYILAKAGVRIWSVEVVYTPTTLSYSATNGNIGGVVYGTSTAVASGTAIAQGGKVTLTAEPASGYVFSNWEVSGTGSALSSTTTNPTTFTMGTANSTVTANFVASGATPTYTVTYVANGGLGTMTDENSPYEENDEVTLLSNTFTAPSGYGFNGWSVKDATNADVTVTNGKFTMPASNVTVTAQWQAYTITAASNNNSYGTVSLNGSVITASPASGYTYASPAYTVSSGSATVEQNGNEFTVTPTSDCTVTINFEAIPTHTATFSVNGETTNQTVAEGAAITFPSNPADISGKKFVGWYTAEYTHASTAPSPLVTSATMGQSDVTYYAVFAEVTTGTPVTDELTTTTFGSPSSYTSWSNKTASSSAKYAGESAGGTNYIQIRATEPSGIVSTTSGGNVTKVTVTWNSGTSDDRTLDIYGKTSAYTNASDLYNDSNKGTLLGSLYHGVTINSVKTTTTELTIDGNYQYIGIRSNKNAMYLDEVDIEWTPINYANYCTSVVVLSASDLAITSSSPVALEITSANISPTSKITWTTSSTGAMSFVSDDTSVATVTSAGVITAIGEGTAKITISQEADASYMASSNLEVTVNVMDNRSACATGIDLPAVQKTLTKGDLNDFAATSTAAVGFTGTITYTYETSDADVVAVATGTYSAEALGTADITITATPTGGNAANYKPASQVVTVTVNGTNSISLDPTSKTVAFSANTFDIAATVPTDNYNGTVSAVSDNTSVATVSVDGTTVTVTPVAVGSAKITVTAGTDTYYPETASADCNVTITAPVGSATAPSSEVVLFNEGFSKTSNTGGRDGSYSGPVSSTVLNSNNTTHTDESWTTITKAYANNYCTKVGKTSESGTLTSAGISFGDDTSGTLTFSAAGWSNDKYTFTGTVAITNAKFKVNNDKVTEYEFEPTQGDFDDYELEIVDITDDVTLTFSGYCYFLDDVKVTKTGPAPTVPATLNSYGYATFCSQYPLDFSSATDVTAWQIKSVDGEEITFEKITTAIKGGQGILLKGAASADVAIPSADSNTELEDNLLVGTTAPTYFAEDAIYGLAGNTFKLNYAGTFKANKAYIPASEIPSSVRAFTFVFVDPTTSITETQNVSAEEFGAIFNLAGQRMNQPQRGVNIINGKKTLFVK